MLGKVLLVDDEQDILVLLKYNLEKENFLVQTASNGREGIEVAKEFMPDIIVLDVMMPEIDGIETCLELREIPELKNVLITFLTARGEDYSQIAGFESGADDYITKPIKPRVFVSRLKALMRRKHEVVVSNDANEGLRIDRDRYIVTVEGEEINLPKKEFELLDLLMSKPGNIFTREVILDSVWGSDIVVGDRTIDVHIRKLREKIGDHYIKTVKGVGYKLAM
jgi:two-component system, OmpR family, alkaline phosphatase synthesis response regulator PhoP